MKLKIHSGQQLIALFLALIVAYSSMIVCLGNDGPPITRQGITDDIIQRRNFLVNNLNGKSLITNHQTQYLGEWNLGAYAMATYALTNIAMLRPETAHESSQIIAGWINSMTKKEFSNFDELAWGENPLDEKVLMADEGHVGYYGHINLMLGCYALLNNDHRFRNLHLKISEALARRMRKYPHHQIQTYPGETYPPDNTVAAASLKVADMTLGTNYKPLIKGWIMATKQLKYPPNGLTVFQIDIKTGIPLQPARGSNAGWDSFFLPLIDEQFARTQFEQFKKHELFQMPGFAGFKEYYHGNWFKCDCDTGPVIFGLGGTATAFAIAGARRSNDATLLSSLLRSVELFGVSTTKGDQKHYLTFPIVGDAIILAMKTACPWRVLWKE